MTIGRARTMTRQLAVLLLQTVVWLAPAGLPAARAAETDAGRLVEVEVPAPALAGNLLGTPVVQGAAVYLPPSYADDPDRRYPVVFLLHGIFDSYETWLVHFEVPAMLDRLIAAGAIPEMILVMPNAGNQYGGGYYRNSPVSGRWADYIADDLVAFVDARYRTLAGAENRAVVGHSMGGHGALHLAMTRPGMFSVVWAMSPCCLVARDDLSFGNDAWKRSAAIASAEDLQELMESDDFYAIATLGVITAFSPAPDRPPVYGNFPFEIVRGEVVLDEDAYDRYLDALPIRQVRNARDALRGLRGFGLDVGLGDQFLHITAGTLAFSQRLGAERIPHLLDVYAGDHREHVGERLERLVLPWVGAYLTPAD